MVSEDRQQTEVVGVEAVEAELGQGDDPDGHAVVAHRHHEHRFVDVVRPGDRLAARIGVRVVDQQWLAVLGDPAGEPLADAAAKQVHVDMLVGAHPALEGDRHHFVGQFHEVHAGVVVVDDLAGLLDDRPAHCLHGRGAVQAPGRGLQDGELRRACLGLLEQLGVRERDAGVRGQGGQERDVAIGPLAWLQGDGGKRPDHPVVVDQRRDEVAGGLDDALGSLGAVPRVLRASDQAAIWPVWRTSPTQPSSTPNGRQRPRGLLGQAGPGRDDQVVVLDDADRDVIDTQRAQRLIDDRAEQLRADRAWRRAVQRCSGRCRAARLAGSRGCRSSLPSASPKAPEPPRRRRYSEGLVSATPGSDPGSGEGSCGGSCALMVAASSHPRPLVPPDHRYLRGSTEVPRPEAVCPVGTVIAARARRFGRRRSTMRTGNIRTR